MIHDLRANAHRIEKNIEDRVDERVHGPLYISPKLLLISVTLLNIALFIGGTVYTGVQVESIQKRYEEASRKIVEAKQKYDDAESRLKYIQIMADRNEGMLIEIQRKSNDMAAQFENTAKDNADKVTAIRERAEHELDLLKTSSTAIVNNMRTHQKDAEAALEKAIDEVSSTLHGEMQSNKEAIEKEIQSHKEAIEKKQTDMDSLGSQINETTRELSTVQKKIKDQIGVAEALNNEVIEKVMDIAKSGKITLHTLFGITDIGVKVALGGSFLLALVSFCGFVVTILLSRMKARTHKGRTGG